MVYRTTHRVTYLQLHRHLELFTQDLRETFRELCDSFFDIACLGRHRTFLIFFKQYFFTLKRINNS